MIRNRTGKVTRIEIGILALTSGFESRMTTQSRRCEAASSVSFLLRKGESVKLSLSSCISPHFFFGNHWFPSFGGAAGLWLA